MRFAKRHVSRTQVTMPSMHMFSCSGIVSPWESFEWCIGGYAGPNGPSPEFSFFAIPRRTSRWRPPWWKIRISPGIFASHSVFRENRTEGTRSTMSMLYRSPFSFFSVKRGRVNILIDAINSNYDDSREEIRQIFGQTMALVNRGRPYSLICR